MGESGHTVLSVLKAAEGWLLQRGVEAPRRSAELLLGKVLGLPRLQLYLQYDRPMGETERAAMRELTARRGRGEPVAHLLGEWSFRRVDLFVTPAVLVPRPETEALVDLILERAPQGARVLDLGTGSGAIAIALAAERPDLRILATDTSAEALAVAQSNVDRHHLGDRVTLAQGSWWAACQGEAPFDLVVANPPYVDPDRTDLLDAAVRAFEPAVALFAQGGDPASCYRAITAGLADGLVAGGWLLCETGVEAAEPALEVLRACPVLRDAELRWDAAGQPRFLLARRR